MAVWTPRGEGPFPLLLTAPRDYQRFWAEDALARGYAVCLFPGVDSHHRETDYPGYEKVWETFRREYPNATWTEISTKGWLAGRCIDYLLSDQSLVRIEPDHIAIIGFSRYGKQPITMTLKFVGMHPSFAPMPPEKHTIKAKDTIDLILKLTKWFGKYGYEIE